MKLEQQVTSLEISKRLKELGVKQESYFTWYKHLSEDDGTEVWTVNGQGDRPYANPMYSAFTVAELGEMLPIASVKTYRLDKRNGDSVYVCEHTDVAFSSDTEADARGKMLIYLIENNLFYQLNKSNMRKIKFRAWHNGEWKKNFNEKMLNNPAYEVVQFTGLHDKNGKEIYESDILQLDGMNIIVEWIHDEHRLGWSPYISCNGNTGFEIIGNIYESPELLPVKE